MRVNQLSDSWVAAGDFLNTEVIFVLDSAGDIAFGLELRAGDPNLPSHLAMLSILGDAYIHKLDAGITYNIEPGKRKGYIKLIDMRQVFGQKLSFYPRILKN
jgi:hypothetical protein